MLIQVSFGALKGPSGNLFLNRSLGLVRQRKIAMQKTNVPGPWPSTLGLNSSPSQAGLPLDAGTAGFSLQSATSRTSPVGIRHRVHPAERSLNSRQPMEGTPHSQSNATYAVLIRTEATKLESQHRQQTPRARPNTKRATHVHRARKRRLGSQTTHTIP